MNHSENVDHDAVLRARTMLLGSGRLRRSQEVEAYRVLAKVSPAAYLPKLVQALVQYTYEPGFRDRPDLRVVVHAEAAEAARGLDASEEQGARLLCTALHAYQHTLFLLGRRTEGLAVCEELAEVARLSMAVRGAKRNRHGGRLATRLAEEGQHSEAADVHASDDRAARALRSESSFADLVAWSAALDAAGRHQEALEVFARLVDDTRRGTEEGSAPRALLVWALVHRSGMLDAAGRGGEAAADRREVLALLDRLARSGDSGDTGDLLARWATLFALSGRAVEPAGSREAPGPPLGHELCHWSHETFDAHFEGFPAHGSEAAGPPWAGSLPGTAIAHYRLTLRSALFQVRDPGRFEESLRPLFDEGVALAHRRPTDPCARVRALTDRAMFLVAVKRYEEAHADFLEAVALQDGTAPAIVTRT
ncbi:hypothetical protein AB0B30_18545 [Streptomyces narbonensis]|uniref:Tetratricopeptide repeat protein n=1 Tax=Streptomyces narbonensis TaxID=67333 RepID=A0ABV3C698_9ACTN